MGHYVVLGKWTEQGIKNVKDLPKRFETSKGVIEKLGGKFVSLYTTMGKYDFVAVIDMPSDEAYMQAALSLGTLGNNRTVSMKAWTLDEASMVLAKL
jgi:uncharacterized protein with GYD domain